MVAANATKSRLIEVFLVYDLALSIVEAINSDCRQGEKHLERAAGWSSYFFLFPDETWEGRQAVRRCCARWKITLRRPGWHDPGGSDAKLVVWLTPSRRRGVRPTQGNRGGWWHPLSADGSIVSSGHKLSRASLGPHFLPSFLPSSPRACRRAYGWLLDLPYRLLPTKPPIRTVTMTRIASATLPSTPEPPWSAWPSLFAPRNT